MNLFRRAWRVQVGSLLVSQSDTDALDVKFKIKRTLASGRAGTCELEISNLTPAHRHELAMARRRQTFVSVDAGYLEGQSRLFTGDLRKALITRDGSDWTAKITAGDGEHAIRTARVSRSFAAGTPLGAAAQALADAMGVGVGNAAAALGAARFSGGSDVFPEGTVLYGQAAAELSRLCASAGLQWSVQNGNLQVLALGGALERTAIRLSRDTGMVGAPEVVSRRAIAVKALLIPGLVPGQQVVVDSAVIDTNRVVAGASWRITEAEYSGDTAGTDWTAALTCHRPRPSLLGAAPPPAA